MRSIDNIKKGILLLSLVFLCGCSSKKKGFRVAATPVPQAQMLEFVQAQLKEEGVDLVIVITEDYNMPNRALAEGEIDANFFQHIPFLEEQIAQFHYPIESIGKIEIEPMGVYSNKVSSLSELQKGDTIAIPNDPTNESRALLLLEQYGVIRLRDSRNFQSTTLDIVENPQEIRFVEIDAAMLPRSLSDVTAAAINTNYALQAGLSPFSDAIAIEEEDSPYANVIAIRIGEEKRLEIEALKQAMTSDRMKEFILETYKGAVLPAF